MMPSTSQTRTDSRSAAHSAAAAIPASQFLGKRIHFIGIGGSGMSGLASMLLDAGAIVTGSDPKPNAQVFELIRRGAKVSRDQIGELLNRQIDLVVRTAAVPASNGEFKAAAALGLQQVKYAEMLGMVMAERLGVAVAGTHGKSTTTAMIAYALIQCGADPSFVVGGSVPQLGGGSRSGGGNAFVAEACEFDRSFHRLRPTVALITNIEEDHLDCYRDIQEIVESFHHFAELAPSAGKVIANGQDAHVRQALKGIDVPIEWVGLGGGLDWSSRVIGIKRGCYRGVVLYRGRELGVLELSVAGEHNLFNATMAVAACVSCGIEPERAIAALAGFTGVDRRMTVVGTVNGAKIVDDYGHHPTEIRATLQALRQQYRPRKLFAIFQPHQHSRTRFLLDDFANSFQQADQTIVPDIYFVRDSESERQKISAKDLVFLLRENGREAIYLPEFADIVAHLRSVAGESDLIVTMGAGNVWEIARDLAAKPS